MGEKKQAGKNLSQSSLHFIQNLFGITAVIKSET